MGFADNLDFRILPYSVIPAKAEIQVFQRPMDSRFRGNDGGGE
jgi:hypothetical protein